MTIKMVSVFVDNPVEAFEFYTNVLGFEELLFMPDASLAIVKAPGQPNGPGLLLEPNENPIAKNYQQSIYNANLPAMVFGSENIDEDYRQLKEKGVVFRTPPTVNAWGTEAVFEDGRGNLIKIHQG
jgi:catechol 2,3-dioxygenase-like lactoylglutathione lyase family enzyme